MNKTVLVASVVGLVFLVAGVFAGFLLEKNITEKDIEKANTTIKAFGSKLIPYVTAFGKIQSISGKDLTLNYNGDTVVIKIKDDAKVSIIETGDDNNTIQKEALFEDLKVGDSVSVNISISSDNAIEGSRVLIVPITESR